MSAASRLMKPKAQAMRKGGSIGVAAGKQQKTILSYFSKTPSSLVERENSDKSGTGNSSKSNPSSPLLKDNDLCEQHLDDEKEVNSNSAKRLKISPPDDLEQKGKSRLLELAQTLRIMDENMGISWFMALEKEFEQEYFKSLNSFVTNARNRGTVFPPAHHVWEWTKQCPIRDVKVVILGQDPYHGPGQAHGLCFSVSNVAPPPSLVNMYKELSDDIPDFITPNHGCLLGWASQGVLLLNAVLTVNAHQANSHKDCGWEKFTDATISWISQNLNNVVFLLWGAFAQKKANMVDKKKHHLLQAVHPSPLSAHRGFFGCKHFSKCNELLKKAGKKEIDWNDLPNPLQK